MRTEIGHCPTHAVCPNCREGWGHWNGTDYAPTVESRRALLRQIGPPVSSLASVGACNAETFHTSTGLSGRCTLPPGHEGAHSALGDPW